MHLVPKISIGLLLALFWAWVWINSRSGGWHMTKTLPLFLLASLALGVYVVVVFLPKVVEFFTTAIFSSNAKVEPEKNSPALSLLAQGDFEGAAAAYLELAESSEDALPYGEAAKIHAERLEDPARGLEILQEALQNRPWGEDDWCYLQFRVVDFLHHYFQDFASARAVLDAVVENCPNTRHSANATTRLRELEEAEMKALRENGGAAAETA